MFGNCKTWMDIQTLYMYTYCKDVCIYIKYHIHMYITKLSQRHQNEIERRHRSNLTSIRCPNLT